MINIKEPNSVFEKLSALQKDTPPVFGKMTAQHMVEHLCLALTFSNGKSPQQLMVSEQLSQAVKHHTIKTDKEMGIGFKAPMLDDEPPQLLFNNLAEAIEKLKQELNNFNLYFNTHPETKPMSPVLGELNYNEWIIFHNKHFTHHFKQFGLI